MEQGFWTSRPWTCTSCQIRGGIRSEIKCTINVTHLESSWNHPLPWVHGTVVFHENRSLVTKSWGHCDSMKIFHSLPFSRAYFLSVGDKSIKSAMYTFKNPVLSDILSAPDRVLQWIADGLVRRLISRRTHLLLDGGETFPGPWRNVHNFNMKRGPSVQRELHESRSRGGSELITREGVLWKR